jgi:hypothetical protein
MKMYYAKFEEATKFYEYKKVGIQSESYTKNDFCPPSVFQVEKLS